MRKSLSCLLAVMHMFWSIAAQADALDQAIDRARELRDVLYEKFDPFLRAKTESMIRNQYLYMFWDHSVAQRALAERSSEGLMNLYGLEKDLRSTMVKLKTVDSKWNENAVHALALVSAAQALKIDAEEVRDNARLIQSSWAESCRQEKLNELAQAVDPMAIYNLIEIDAPPDSPPVNYEIHVTYSSGGGPDGNGSGATVKTDDSEAGTYGAAMITAGIASCAYGGPWGIVIGVILIVAGALVSWMAAFAEEAKIAEKEGKLWEIKNEIRNHQLNVMAAVSKEVPEMTRKSCQSSFPAEKLDAIPLEIYKTYLEKTSDALPVFESAREEVYTLYSERIAQLETTYYPQVQKTFQALVDQRMQKAAEIDQQILKMGKSTFSPLLKSIEDRSIISEKWSSEQKLWSALIMGDAQFRTRSLFSFVPGGEVAIPSFDNRWNDLGPILKGKIQ